MLDSQLTAGKSIAIKRRFTIAPWSKGLKVMSVFGGVVLLGVGIGAAQAIPEGTNMPFAHAVGTVVAFVPPAVALFAVLFVVTGYKLEPHQLLINRLLWSTRIPLEGLQHIVAAPDLMQCSIKVCGNGGLFSITGSYQNHALGRYRAFVTNPTHAVALFFADRVVVVSPEDTQAFVHSVRSQIPDVQLGLPDTSSNV